MDMRDALHAKPDERSPLAQKEAGEAGTSSSPSWTDAAYWRRSLRAMFLEQWMLSLLHVFLPATMVARAVLGRRHEGATFFFALLACVPLAERLSYTTEQLALCTSHHLAGFINVCMGNLPELVITLVALFNGRADVAKYALVGGILSSALLVAGLSFLAGGLRHRTQSFNSYLASSLVFQMLVASAAIFLCSAIPNTLLVAGNADELISAGVNVSRVVAVIMLLGSPHTRAPLPAPPMPTRGPAAPPPLHLPHTPLRPGARGQARGRAGGDEGGGGDGR